MHTHVRDNLDPSVLLQNYDMLCCTVCLVGGAAKPGTAAEAAVQQHGSSATIRQHHHCESKQHFTSGDLLWTGKGS